MLIGYLKDFFLCVFATVFFAFLFRVPHRAIAVSAILGGVGYLIYEWMSSILGYSTAGYFIGTLFMAICCEILARIMKMPATIFVIPSIIPLVPGVGLYNTMLYLVEGQNMRAGKTGVTTLLAIISMAMALVLTSVLTKIVTSFVQSIKSKQKTS